MKKLILVILAVCMVSTFSGAAESCDTAGATEKKYTPRQCGYSTEMRICCADGTWSKWIDSNSRGALYEACGQEKCKEGIIKTIKLYAGNGKFAGTRVCKSVCKGDEVSYEEDHIECNKSDGFYYAWHPYANEYVCGSHVMMRATTADKRIEIAPKDGKDPTMFTYLSDDEFLNRKGGNCTGNGYDYRRLSNRVQEALYTHYYQCLPHRQLGDWFTKTWTLDEVTTPVHWEVDGLPNGCNSSDPKSGGPMQEELYRHNERYASCGDGGGAGMCTITGEELVGKQHYTVWTVCSITDYGTGESCEELNFNVN